MSSAYINALNVLGLKQGATEAEIKEAYRDLVAVWHPDKYTGNERLRLKAEEMLKAINNAKDFLMSGSFNADDWADESEPEPEEWSEDEVETPEDEPTVDDLSEPEPEEPAPSVSTNSSHIATVRNWVAALICCAGLFAWLAYVNKPLKSETQRRTSEPSVSQQDIDRALMEPTAQEMSVDEAKDILRRAQESGLLKGEKEEGLENANALVQPDLGDEQKANLEAERDFEPEPDPEPDVKNASKSKASSGTTKPKPSATQNNFFTLGSSKEEVEEIQGTPTAIYGDSWSYDFSSIRFTDGRVTSYSDIGENLKVKVAPNEISKATRIGVGSTIDEVLSVQGTPTAIYGESFSYGFSSVRFSDGLVVGYSDIGKNLKLK